jgi:phosphoglycerate dehydrogenase-like enzyme
MGTRLFGKTLGILGMGQIGQLVAGLDVYETEVPEPDPGPRKGLLNLPNVFFTPHIGSAARETREEMALRTVRNIEMFLAGERPLDVLNPEVYGEAATEDERIG